MQPTIDDNYILSFLGNHPLATLSTVTKEGAPDAAPIYIVVEDNFDVFFITPVNTQKYANLISQKNAVLTITNEADLETVRIKGKMVDDGLKPLSEVIEKLSAKLNQEHHFVTTLPLLKYKDQEKKVVKIQPTEIRMRRFTTTDIQEKLISFDG